VFHCVVQERIRSRHTVDHLLPVRQVLVPIANVVLVELELRQTSIRITGLHAVPTILLRSQNADERKPVPKSLPEIVYFGSVSDAVDYDLRRKHAK
jgi:hypothetical protein